MGETALAREKTEEERESERERGKEYPVPVAAARPNRAEARPRAPGARAEARAAGPFGIEATRPSRRDEAARPGERPWVRAARPTATAARPGDWCEAEGVSGITEGPPRLLGYTDAHTFTFLHMHNCNYA